jgi:hypothetical protein
MSGNEWDVDVVVAITSRSVECSYVMHVAHAHARSAVSRTDYTSLDVQNWLSTDNLHLGRKVPDC